MSSARYQNVALGLTLAACLVAPWLSVVPLAAQLGLVAAVIVFVGLPHGAYDWVVAGRSMNATFHRTWWLPFVLGYLAVAGLVLTGWLLLPQLLIPAFIIFSAVHFGAEWAGTSAHRSIEAWLRSLGRGSCYLGPTLLAWSGPVHAVFAAMVPGTAWSQNAFFSLGIILTTAAAVHVVLEWRHHRDARNPVPELLAVLAVAALLPPLLSFAVFFALWHSIPHTIALIEDQPQPRFRDRFKAFARITAPLVGVASFGGLFAWIWLTQNTLPFAAAQAVVFVGLSVLAIPHMLLPHVLRALEPRLAKTTAVAH